MLEQVVVGSPIARHHVSLVVVGIFQGIGVGLRASRGTAV